MLSRGAQFLLRYPQAEPSLHKDVYEVIMYAVEHSSASTNDKERIAKLWRDFLKVKRRSAPLWMALMDTGTFVVRSNAKPHVLTNGSASSVQHTAYFDFCLCPVLQEMLRLPSSVFLAEGEGGRVRAPTTPVLGQSPLHLDCSPLLSTWQRRERS